MAIGNTTYYANADIESEEASADAARIVPDEPTVLRAEVAALHARRSATPQELAVLQSEPPAMAGTAPVSGTELKVIQS